MMNGEPKGFKEFLEQKISALMKTRQSITYASNATVRQMFYEDALVEFQHVIAAIDESHHIAKKAKSALRMRRINHKRPILCH